MPEILNIEYHTKRLLLRAPNSGCTTKEAAKKLGISERNLFYLTEQYGIVRKAVYVIEGDYELKHKIKIQ